MGLKRVVNVQSRFVQFPLLLFISHHVLSPISIENR